MSEYERVVDAKGVVRYKLDGKFVKAAEVPEDVKTNLIDGDAIEEVKVEAPVVDPGASADDVDDESGIDEEIVVPKVAQKDAEGWGFPIVNGKTVDIFDGKTPHETVRYVSNLVVPLTMENYKTKSDAEVVEQLKKMKKI